jgi:hypothetical protein
MVSVGGHGFVKVQLRQGDDDVANALQDQRLDNGQFAMRDAFFHVADINLVGYIWQVG